MDPTTLVGENMSSSSTSNLTPKNDYDFMSEELNSITSKITSTEANCKLEKEEGNDSGGILPESGCVEACPFDMICEFLQVVMQKKYPEAIELCKKILVYEPENRVVKEFLNLLTADGVLNSGESSCSEEEDKSSEDDAEDGISSSSSDDERDSTYSTGDEEEVGEFGGNGNAAAIAETDELTDAFLEQALQKMGVGSGEMDALEQFFSMDKGPSSVNKEEDEDDDDGSSCSSSSSTSDSGESSSDSDEEESFSSTQESLNSSESEEDHDSGITSKGFSF